MSATPREGAVTITGDRFEAPVSPNREFADIVDLKEMKRLTLMDVASLRELRDLANEVIEFMER